MEKLDLLCIQIPLYVIPVIILQEVDIVSADISIQAVREEVVDFVHPYLFEVNAVMIRRPDPTAQKQKTYMRPFSLYAWVTLGAVLVFVIIVFYFAEAIAGPYIYPEKKRAEESSFTELAFFILGALVQHGTRLNILQNEPRFRLLDGVKHLCYINYQP